MPALSRAREQGYRTKCLSNEHNVGQMIIMYQNDERQYPSWSVTDTSVTPNVTYYDSSLTLGVLYVTYGQTPELFVCPSTDDDVAMATQDESGNDVYLTKYSTTPDRRFWSHTSAYAELPVPAPCPNDPSYVIDPSVPKTPWPSRAIYADGPDMSLLRADVGPGFAASQFANHENGANVLFADGSVQFYRMLGDGRLVEPKTTASDIPPVLIPPAPAGTTASAIVANTDIYADDFLSYDAGGNPLYGGDTKMDAHLGTWVDDHNSAIQDSPNGWVGPDNFATYGINDVFIP